jgi:hypothetical protein
MCLPEIFIFQKVSVACWLSQKTNQTFRGTALGGLLIRLETVSLLSRVSSITAKHHKKQKNLKKKKKIPWE